MGRDERKNRMSESSSIIARLMAVLEDRRARRPAGSYTVQLLEGGVDQIAPKLREEIEEVIEAAGRIAGGDHAHLVHEAADVIYHLLVLLAWAGIPLSDVEAELGRRFGVSGLEEKASRPRKE